MNDPRFPVLKSHRDVICFNCDEQLDIRGMFDTDYPAGRYGQHCRRCDMATYYDLEPRTTLIDNRPYQRKIR